MNPEILTISPKDFPGVTSQFRHLAATTGMTEHDVTISRETMEGKKMVIFGAWSHYYYRALKRLRAEPVKIGLLWTSPIGQVGFSPNFIEVSFLYIIKDAIRSGMLDYLFIPTERILKAFRKIFSEDIVRYLPNTYDIDGIREKYLDVDLQPHENWVSLFSPFGVRKNLLNQMLAAKLAGVKLHMNNLIPQLRDFADLIELDYVDMGWMSAESYFRSIQTMKCGLKVSYSETFDYSLFDHMVFGIPCLISRTIEWIQAKEPWLNLIVDNFDDPNEIAEKLKLLVKGDGIVNFYSRKVMELAREVAEKGNKTCIRTLREAIE